MNRLLRLWKALCDVFTYTMTNRHDPEPTVAPEIWPLTPTPRVPEPPVKPRETPLPVELPPPPAPTPLPAPVPPEYLWDTKAQIIHSMRVIGDEEGLTVLQKDLLCDICGCESGYKLRATLVNSPKSIDRGLFQINNYYHAAATDLLAYDPEWSTRWACRAILTKEAHALWSASEKCWNASGKYDGII